MGTQPRTHGEPHVACFKRIERLGSRRSFMRFMRAMRVRREGCLKAMMKNTTCGRASSRCLAAAIDQQAVWRRPGGMRGNREGSCFTSNVGCRAGRDGAGRGGEGESSRR